MKFNWFFFGTILTGVGDLIIAYTVLSVHAHIMKEHRIDRDVLKVMRRERYLAGSGLFFIVAGLILQIINEVVK